MKNIATYLLFFSIFASTCGEKKLQQKIIPIKKTDTRAEIEKALPCQQHKIFCYSCALGCCLITPVLLIPFLACMNNRERC